jgi:hypothetical protein
MLWIDGREWVVCTWFSKASSCVGNYTDTDTAYKGAVQTSECFDHRMHSATLPPTHPTNAIACVQSLTLMITWMAEFSFITSVSLGLGTGHQHLHKSIRNSTACFHAGLRVAAVCICPRPDTTQSAVATHRTHAAILALFGLRHRTTLCTGRTFSTKLVLRIGRAPSLGASAALGSAQLAGSGPFSFQPDGAYSRNCAANKDVRHLSNTHHASRTRALVHALAYAMYVYMHALRNEAAAAF